MKSTERTRQTAQNVLDWIHDNPQQHNQELVHSQLGSDTCGTTMCIAGNLLAQKYGLQTGHDFRRWWDDNGYEQVQIPGFKDRHAYAWVRTAGQELGLTQDEAWDLFYTLDNEDAVQKLKHIVVGEPWDEDLG